MGTCVSGEAEGESELSLFRENVLLQRAGKRETEQGGTHHLTGDWCILGGEAGPIGLIH